MSRSSRPKFNSEWVKLHDGSKITLRSLKKEDIPQCLEIRKSVYGSPFTEEEWKWKYGPKSPFFYDVLVAEFKKMIIGIQSLLLFPFSIKGKTVRALNLLDLMVKPQWQKKGIFGHIIKKIERELLNHFSFIYTIPNDRSYRGFTEKFGWTSLFDPLILTRPALFYPGTHLYDRQISQIGTGIIKDDIYTRWRYSRPGRNYLFFGQHGVVAIEKKLRIKAGFAAEFPSPPSSALLRRMENSISPFPLLFLTNPFSPNLKFLKSKGFSKQLNHFRKIHLVVKLNPFLKNLHSLLSEWDITFGDFDVI